MPARDPIDDVISEADRTRGTLPPEPSPEFEPAAWASSASSTTTPPSNRRKSSPVATIALVIVIAVVVASLAAVAFRHEPTQFDRFRIAAENLIAKNLKSPATASFAPSEEWAFEKIDDATWRMRAWVDSQNSFAALLRSNFTTIVRSTDGEWQILYLKLGDTSKAFGAYLLTPAETETKAASERARAAAAVAELDAGIAQRERLEKTRREEAAAAVADAAARKKMREQLDEVRAEATEQDGRREAEEKIEEARHRREQLEADKAALAKQIADEEAKYHKFQTADGTLLADAMPISFAGGTLTVEGRDGKRSKIEISVLRESDQAFVAKWKRDR